MKHYNQDAHLTLHDLQQILAALYEGVNMCEYARLIQYPLLRTVLVVDPTQMAVRVLPRLAATDALFQCLAAALHETIKDVVQGELSHATLDDVTTDL